MIIRAQKTTPIAWLQAHACKKIIQIASAPVGCLQYFESCPAYLVLKKINDVIILNG